MEGFDEIGVQVVLPLDLARLGHFFRKSDRVAGFLHADLVVDRVVAHGDVVAERAFAEVGRIGSRHADLLAGGLHHRLEGADVLGAELGRIGIGDVGRHDFLAHAQPFRLAGCQFEQLNRLHRLLHLVWPEPKGLILRQTCEER
ncbi:hypothetical protein AT6N2_C1966 [Agrobacterium tumefaciens]|nr:hypothetical protein AT6N2_C1966 [Agrobacterium tumefaciens]